MTDPKPATICRSLLPLVLLAVPGCSLFWGPNGKQDNSRYQAVGAELSSSETAEAYMAVRQARTQNAIVLQVAGDSQPSRILPLPTGKSVYVSNLLEQTGVLNKLENVNVVLFRASPSSIDGLQMVVGMTSDGKQVRPECDYALQPGDKIRVTKVDKDTVRALLDMTLGR